MESTNVSSQVSPEGPLEKYRSQASFSSKDMRITMEGSERLAIKEKVWAFLGSDSCFWPSSNVIPSGELKNKTAKLLDKLLFSGLFNNVLDMDYKEKTLYLLTVNEAVEMLNANLSIKFALGISLCANAILSLGTERHLEFVKDLWHGKVLGCLAITEVAHGSDTKRMQTTATYDHLTKEFVLNSSTIGAAKCWVGNLGKQCTHGLVFAQLIVDNVCHGLNVFIVPIRGVYDMIPFPNITVGDIGEKDGLNGIDNGYIMFNKYRIPKENLLNRVGDINEDGYYETSFTDPKKLLGAALESLSAGRVAIISESCNTLIKAVVIAVRYAAQRVQFSDTNNEELALIEYQTHQWRLFPYVAAAYAFKSFVYDFSERYTSLVAESNEGGGDTDIKAASEMVRGVHALVCCAKSLITWTSRDAIQECREACGGHGYHKAAGLGDLRSNHDPRVTFEGDNTVLLQQTSNWLLRTFTDPNVDFSIFPASEILFIRQKETILQRKCSAATSRSFSHEKFIMEAYEWLICWLAKSTCEQMESLKSYLQDRFIIRNQCQVFKARTLSLAFAEFIILSFFLRKCNSCDDRLKPVLRNLYRLYGYWLLYKHVPIFYQGGYCCDPSLVERISGSMLGLCQSLKPEMIGLTDALAPPDFVLNSVLGCSDGKVYERLVSAFNLPYSLASTLSNDSVMLKSKL